MFNLRNVLYAVGVTSLFILLTIFAVVSYNGSQEENKAKQGAVYQKVSKIIDSSAQFLDKITPKRHKDKEEEYLEKATWSERIKEYFLISREKEGLSIIIKNSKGEFVEKILPIFKKKSD